MKLPGKWLIKNILFYSMQDWIIHNLAQQVFCNFRQEVGCKETTRSHRKQSSGCQDKIKDTRENLWNYKVVIYLKVYILCLWGRHQNFLHYRLSLVSSIVTYTDKKSDVNLCMVQFGLILTCCLQRLYTVARMGGGGQEVDRGNVQSSSSELMYFPCILQSYSVQTTCEEFSVPRCPSGCWILYLDNT